ncbi:MAG: CoA-binding protein [Promethearchaeota archaeon]
MIDDNKIKSLDRIFKPQNVVIFEAKEKLSYFVEGFKSQGFNLNNLYLVSPSEDELFDIKCFKSIDKIPIEMIDLLILAVRRDKLIQSLNEILEQKEVKFIHLFTAGTGEFDEIGVKIEDQIKEILNKKYIKTRAIGPNCFGIYCPSGNNSYLPVFPLESGNIGLIFHSGDLHSRTIIYGVTRYNLRFSKGASIGNCVDLQVSDFLEYLNQDIETEIICIYFEGFSRYGKMEGKKLFNLFKHMRKPVLFLRGGKTKRGQSAVLTHTGSLGTDEKIWDCVYKQTPLIKVESSLDELTDYLYIFYEFYKKNRNLTLEDQIKLYPKSKNALIISWSGGEGIIDTDILTKLGVNMPLFKGKTKEKLMEAHPQFKVGSLSNPLDLPWISSTKEYLNICKSAISENIDLIVIYKDPDRQKDERSKKRYDILLEIKKYIESLNKILIIITREYPDEKRIKFYFRLIKDGFIVYPDIKRAAKSFLAFYMYGKKMRRIINNNKL